MFLFWALGRLDRNNGLSPNSLNNSAAQALGATFHTLVFLSPALHGPPAISGDELELQAGTPRVKYEDVHLPYNKRPTQGPGFRPPCVSRAATSSRQHRAYRYRTGTRRPGRRSGH